MQDIAEPSRLPQYIRANKSMTVTPYFDMYSYVQYGFYTISFSEG
jgi:hypothetical protein